VAFLPTDPDGDPVTIEQLEVPAGLEGELVDDRLVLRPDYELEGPAMATIDLSDGKGGDGELGIDLDIRALDWLENHEWSGAAGPEAREHGSVLVDRANSQIFVFHGSGYSPQFEQMLDDVWRFDVDDGTWSEVAPLGDLPPGAGSRRIAGAAGAYARYLSRVNITPLIGPIRATAIDGVEVSTEQEDMTITGNCTSSSTDFSGSMLLSSYQDYYNPVEPTWDGELRGLTLSTESFAANGTGTAVETLLLSGSVSGIEDIRLDSQGGDSASEWGGINLALGLEVTGLSTGIPEFLRERSTDLQIQQTHKLDTCHTEQSCDFEEETFSTTGSASRGTSTGSWMAETVDLNWLYRFKTPEPGDPKQETGCYFEPSSGEIQVTAPGANGPAEPWTASITFDGDQACDGCGQVTIGETSVGLWCGLAPLEAGS
jgi:hypothetical protein